MALRVADKVAEGHLDRLRQEGRQQVLAVILGDRQYPEGAAIARKMGIQEEKIYDLLVEASEINGADDYMVLESVYGLDMRVLD